MNSLRVYFLSRIFRFRWPKWRRLGFYRLKFWLVGVMAMSTQEVSPLSWATKISGPFSVDPRSPGLVNVPMAFATELVAFCEIDELPVEESQFVAISCVVAIQAPSHRLSMMELDIRMFVFQFSFFAIDLHGGMAIATWKHTLGHGRSRDRELLAGAAHKGDKTKP